MKGGLAVAALAAMGEQAWGAVTPDRYLWLQVHMAGTKASLPDLSRVYPMVGAVANYIEFPTKAAVWGTANPQPNQAVSVYVPNDARLYFSEDPAPSAAAPGAGLSQPPKLVGMGPKGMFLEDGSPATVQSSPHGFADGVSGRTKAGEQLSVSLKVSEAKFAGRTSADVTWAVCSSTVASSASAAPLLLNFCFSPEADLATLAMSYEHVTTAVTVDLAAVVNGAGYQYLRRNASYFGHPFSQQTLNVPAPGAVVSMPLAGSPMGAAMERIAAFRPALATIVQPAPAGSPLLSPGVLDVGMTEARAAYVSRACGVVAPVLPALAASLCEQGRPGFADLGRWLGWQLVSDQVALAGAFGAAWDDYKQQQKSSGPGGPTGRRPIMLDNGTDELQDQILDWVADQRG